MTVTADSRRRPRSRRIGRVVRVIGPVVDVEFAAGRDAGDLQRAARRASTLGERRPRTLTLEVAQHIGDNMVRAISMQPTDGLVRGAAVTDTGAPDHGARSAT